MSNSFERTMWSLGILVVLVLMAWAIVYVSQTRVEPWPERLPDVQLEPTRPVLLAKDVTDRNAFFYIVQLSNAIPRDEVAAWPSDEWEELSACGWPDGGLTGLVAWAAQAEPALQLARKATDGLECQVETMTSFEQTMPYISPLLRIARIDSAMAERSAAQGNWNDALSRYRTVLILGDHVSRGGPLIGHLVNYAATAIACRSLRRAALNHPPGRDAVAYMMSLLDQLDRNAEPFAEAIRYEHLAAISAVDLIMKDPAALTSLDGGNRSRRATWGIRIARYPLMLLTGSTRAKMKEHFAAVYSHMVDIASAAHADGRSFEDAMPGFDRKGGFLKTVGTFTDDGIGRILTAILVPALDSARDRAFAYHSELRATKVVLALVAWKQDHKSYPASLEELVPDYLGAIPDDPFRRDVGPLGYSATNGGFVVYSVGPDGVDNAGVTDWLSARSTPKEGEDCVFGPGEALARCEAYREKHPAE